MPACPSGAEPKPGLNVDTVLLVLGGGLTDLVAHVGHFWPSAASNAVLGQASLATLCNDNPDDPGPPTAEDLVMTTNSLLNAAAGSLAYGYGSWLYRQVYYQNFLLNCQCKSVAETIPPRQLVPPPDNLAPYPTAPSDQQQLTRIENTQADHFNALTTLYNGSMELNAQVGDLSWYIRPNFVGSGGHPIATISGEGHLALSGFSGQANYLPGDMAGIRLVVQQLPTKFKVRGSIAPRYYGIGSVEWITSDTSSGLDVVSERVSIHYRQQYAPMPPGAFHPRLAYRLMPGAQVQVQVVTRGVTGAWYGNQGWDERALLRLDQDVPPSDWVDSPFYPPAAARARQFALGGVP